LQRAFLCGAAVNLSLQHEVGPGMQQVQPLDFQSVQLIVDGLQVLRDLLDDGFDMAAWQLRHLLFSSWIYPAGREDLIAS
jgi:hypothetical protein